MSSSRPLRVYLCSRTKPEYREQNEIVAAALEDAGFEVFVPHRLDEVEPAHKANPFPRDYEEMLHADVCVSVGPFGPDCAAEIGWFAGQDRPVYNVYKDTTALCDFVADQPMVSGFVHEYYAANGLHLLVEALYEVVELLNDQGDSDFYDPI